MNQANPKERFVALLGYWDERLEAALDTDPGFFESYLGMLAVAVDGGPLDRKTCDLVLLAANASVTHLHAPSVSAHLSSAVLNGATKAEILEVLQLASVLGIHGYMLGAPILIEEARKVDPGRFRAGQRENAIREAFRSSRGYWSPLLEDLLLASPDFWEAYTAFSSHPWKTGVLPPRTKELIYVAIDASTTHLHEAGTRIHTANALRHGAAPEEVLQVLQLVSCMGMQTYLLGLPEVLAKAEASPGAKA
ncbi:carboxymuconolactone decarboxylase family protein [Micromonospora sp. STR1s_5]|nr:carboxymuconolactone decarboxylase family protein [Micromonospora sp. STR1s_5]